MKQTLLFFLFFLLCFSCDSYRHFLINGKSELLNIQTTKGLLQISSYDLTYTLLTVEIQVDTTINNIEIFADSLGVLYNSKKEEFLISYTKRKDESGKIIETYDSRYPQKKIMQVTQCSSIFIQLFRTNTYDFKFSMTVYTKGFLKCNNENLLPDSLTVVNPYYKE